MFQLANIIKEYDTGKTKIYALRGVSCSLPAGKTIAVLGKSGCGKSTLLNILGGLDRPSSGKIKFQNSDLTSLSSSHLANYRKTKVGIIFQSFNLINSLTAWENVAMALAIGGVPRKKRKAAAIELLEQVELGQRATHLPSELSGGECQRVAIARAIANNPEILLADEPTGNLDTETSAIIMNLLLNLNRQRGKTVIMVTHDRENALKFADNILTLKDGTIINWE
jgi:putative ABC transport system ATP-binding protein